MDDQPFVLPSFPPTVFAGAGLRELSDLRRRLPSSAETTARKKYSSCSMGKLNNYQSNGLRSVSLDEVFANALQIVLVALCGHEGRRFQVHVEQSFVGLTKDEVLNVPVDVSHQL